MDDGGYRRAELWREPFLKDGRTLTFDAAMAQFRDATGRPGPATWEMGSYVAGQDDYPVAGVSWYEAAAYARWAGKSLPTIYHWSRAADQRAERRRRAGQQLQRQVAAPGRRFGRHHPRRHDRHGRQRERVVPECHRREPLHPRRRVERTASTCSTTRTPCRRSRATRRYGFRCIKVGSAGGSVCIADGRHRVSVTGPAQGETGQRAGLPGVAQLLYSFDHGDLNAKVESVDDSSPEWRMEKVSYAAAYGGERIPAYLFLPKNAKPPYQVVVVFPGSNAIYERSSANVGGDVDRFNFIMRSGRALLYPIYKSTFERGDGLKD